MTWAPNRRAVAGALAGLAVLSLLVDWPGLPLVVLPLLAAVSLPALGGPLTRALLGFALAVSTVAAAGVVLGFFAANVDRRLVLGFVFLVFFGIAVRRAGVVDLRPRADAALLAPFALALVLGGLVLVRQRPAYPWLRYGTDSFGHFTLMNLSAHDTGVRYAGFFYPHAFHWVFAAVLGAACRGGTALHVRAGTSYLYASRACSPDAIVRYYVESHIVLWAVAMLALAGAAARLASRNRVLAAGLVAVLYSGATFFAQPLVNGSWAALAACSLIALTILIWTLTRDGSYVDLGTILLGALLVLTAHTYQTILPFVGVAWLFVAVKARRSVTASVAVSGIVLTLPALIALRRLGAGYVDTPGQIPSPNWALYALIFLFAAVTLLQRRELRVALAPISALVAVFAWAAVSNIHTFGHLQYYAIRSLLFLAVALVPFAGAAVADLVPGIRTRLELLAVVVVAVPIVLTFNLSRGGLAPNSKTLPGVALVIQDAGTPRRSPAQPAIVWQNDLTIDHVTTRGWLVVFGASGDLTQHPPTPAQKQAVCTMLRTDPTAVILTLAPDVVSQALAHGRCEPLSILGAPEQVHPAS